MDGETLPLGGSFLQITRNYNLAMPTLIIPSERLDRLAHEAVLRVFKEMVGEAMEAKEVANLIGDEKADLFGLLGIGGERFFTIVVNFVGDANGRVMLTLPWACAERFALRLLDVANLEWLGEDPAETLRDTLGELGNMLAGLVKGGLTKWYPKLTLGTPRVMVSKRLKLDNGMLSFRRQYLFAGFGSRALLDFCYD